jgi:predicted ester cyclase
MSATDHNTAIVRQCFTEAVRGNRAGLEQILGPDFVIHVPEDHEGVDGLLGMVQVFRSALPDLVVTIDHQFAAGDYVATRFTVRGTHQGELFGTAGTSREVELKGITLTRCENGMIAEEWELVDAVGLLQQIGALPEGAPA